MVHVITLIDSCGRHRAQHDKQLLAYQLQVTLHRDIMGRRMNARQEAAGSVTQHQMCIIFPVCFFSLCEFQQSDVISAAHTD